MDTFKEAKEKALEDSHRYTVLRLRDLPKGEFEAHDYIDDDGITAEPLYVKVKVKISGEDFVMDLTGSSPQAKGPINSPLPGTIGAVRITYVALLDPRYLFINHRFLKPLKVYAPEGTVFNPSRNAPVETFW